MNADSPTQNHYIMNDGNGTGHDGSFAIYHNTSGQLGMWIGANGSGYAYGLLTISGGLSGSWMHFVVSVDGSTATVYKNGSSAGTISLTPHSTAGILPLNIGRLGTYNGFYFKGLLDQIRYFNKAISSTEVTQLYNETASTINTLQVLGDTSCVFAYPLQNNAIDLSGTYSGTASNLTFDNPGHLTINKNGTLESTVSANPDAGFSIVRNTGTSNYSDTIGHGLSQPPELIIQKGATATTDWYLLVNLNGTGAWDWTKINSTLAFSAVTQGFTTNSTTIDNWGWTNYDMINYCWHSVAGYSKIGTYVGTGGTNNVSVGFTPSWVMIKNTTAAGSFLIYDAARSPYDPRNKSINLTYTSAETTQSTMRVNFNSISDGFTLLGALGATNQSGVTYLYMAFK